MKIKLFLFMVIILGILPQNQLSAQNHEKGYKISCYIKNLTAEKVFMSYILSKRVGISDIIKDSTLVVDGNFVFSGKQLPFPVYCDIRNEDDSFVISFWLDNNDVIIKGEINKPFVVIGSKTQDESKAMSVFTNAKTTSRLVSEKRKEFKSALDKNNLAMADSIKNIIDNILIEYNSKCELFVKEHPDSYISLNYVWNRTMLDKISYEDFNRLFNYLDEDVRSSTRGLVLSDRLDSMKQVIVGQVFPQYEQPDINGNSVKISDFKGKYLLLTFSGSWEKGYRKENQLTKLYLFNKYNEKGLEFVDVLFENNKDALQKVIDEDKVKWKIVSDLQSWNNPAVERFIIDNITQNFLINPEGVIIAKNIFGKKLEDEINSIFNKK